MRALSFLLPLILTAALSAQDITSSGPDTWTVDTDYTVTVTGGVENETCHLILTDGFGNEEEYFLQYNQEGVAVFRITCPDWDSVTLSIDPDSFDDDVYKDVSQ